MYGDWSFDDLHLTLLLSHLCLRLHPSFHQGIRTNSSSCLRHKHVLKTLEYLGRNLLLKLLNRRQLKAAPSFSSPSSILVIRTDPRVGNVIMLTAFLKEIQLAYPKARLTLLGPAKAKTLLCLLYTSPSPRDRQKSRMPSSA